MGSSQGREMMSNGCNANYRWQYFLDCKINERSPFRGMICSKPLFPYTTYHSNIEIVYSGQKSHLPSKSIRSQLSRYNLYSKIINYKFNHELVFIHLRYDTLESLLRSLRWKNKTKVQLYFCTLTKFGSLGVHNAMNNDRLKQVRIPLSAVK